MKVPREIKESIQGSMVYFVLVDETTVMSYVEKLVICIHLMDEIQAH